ncbi:HNH endonuclease signature motif containing protein [Croceitalea sp. MTPC9]|uniref:HNH endonuclease n=1 Tax=unclassified Croceitalea TaxID=2632280 RepID=UPI002B3D1D9E|nr:HNH endonuclease signature motif containing protein [Croceitalea sp. MTPC6]GMN16845.1 HNH endonuclease signature motif containing protein [Croceitalea sp. MTPC9]
MSKPWKDDELKSAIEAYIFMLEKTRNGEKLNKAKTYRELALKHGRDANAFEYRMSNISYVLALHGRQWLKGLSPLSNAGHNIVTRMESILSKIENRPINHSVIVESKVNQELSKTKLSEPRGKIKPKKSISEGIVYDRDPSVKAWVLKIAKGVCELCNNKAPFKSVGGVEFLEVHHVVRLADGGPDVIENAVALCPNCHREMHYGIKQFEKMEVIYGNVGRLKRF